MFQKPCVSRNAAIRRLMWARHALKVIEEEPLGKRRLGKLRIRWEDCVKRTGRK